MTHSSYMEKIQMQFWMGLWFALICFLYVCKSRNRNVASRVANQWCADDTCSTTGSPQKKSPDLAVFANYSVNTPFIFNVRLPTWCRWRQRGWIKCIQLALQVFSVSWLQHTSELRRIWSVARNGKIPAYDSSAYETTAFYKTYFSL